MHVPHQVNLPAIVIGQAAFADVLPRRRPEERLVCRMQLGIEVTKDEVEKAHHMERSDTRDPTSDAVERQMGLSAMKCGGG